MLATAEAKLTEDRAGWLPRWCTVNPLVHHGLAILGLLLSPLLVFAPGLVNGDVFYGKDTLQFYYPLTEWFVGQLRGGTIPLWIPHIFGGYPLFADGEIGMAHPLVLLTGLLFSPETAITLLRSLHFGLAAVLAYWLAVVLGLRPFGAVIAGLVFAFGSFLVGHMQHDNILRSAVWLPALLALAELALRAGGVTRLRYALLGGLVVGVQLLGVHIQPVLISLLTAAGWVVLGPFRSEVSNDTGRPDGRPRGAAANGTVGQLPAVMLERVISFTFERVTRLWIWGVILVVGIAVSAVQLLPLFVLSGLTMRGAGVNYFVSTSYALSPPELLTLLFPFFFRSGPEQHWSLWPPQETTLYLGVLPLLLAAVAVFFVRSRVVAWLTLGVLLNLWLALGDYATPNPYYWLWNLPGFSVMRAPARFSLVIMLAVGCLAGIGADWLNRRASQGFGRWEAFWLRALALTWVGMLAVLLGVAGVLRMTLEAMPLEVMQSIDFSYLTFRRELQQLGAPSVLAGLSAAVDLNNPSTRLSFIWIALAPLAVWSWTLANRWRAWCRVGSVLLVATDLLMFAGAFYPQAPGRELHSTHPAIQELVARNDAHHVLLDPGLNHLIGSNQLVHYGVSAAGGYSSLEPSRFIDYWWGMVRDENVLLDLFNVRYVVAPRQQAGSLLFNETRFHPAERLVNGGALNPAGSEVLRGSSTYADRLTVISAVDGLDGAEIGESVAQVSLIATDGEERRYGLRYGLELTGYRRGAPNPVNALWAYYGPAFVPNGQSFPSQLAGTVLPIDPPMEIDRIEVRNLAPSGVLLLHGLGLRDAGSYATRSLTTTDRMKYRSVYQDADVVILENQQALPKVYFRTSAEPMPVDAPAAGDLVAAARDLRQGIVLDRADSAAAHESAAESPAQTELLENRASMLRARTSSDAAGFLVVGDRFDLGWRAWVDGQEAPVIRANAVMRAVQVGAGEHRVEMRYDPWWVPVGLMISVVAVLGVLIAVAVLSRQPQRVAHERESSPATS
ncbi:MAG: YfhO family protein [Chloroflexota bacterium]